MEIKWTYENVYNEALNYNSRSEFAKGNKGAYNVAIQNKWINDYKWFKRPVNPNKKWDEKTIMEEAKNYNSINEFRKNNKRAYNLACENGWINNYDFLKRRGDEPSFEDCLFEAKKYNKRSDFSLKSRKCYDTAKKYGWMEKYDWLAPKISDYENERLDSIYSYSFDDLNAIYIGRTIDIEARDNQHRTDKDDSVYKFAKKNKLDIPPMVVVENDLTLKEGQNREGYWMEYYKQLGKKLINVAKPGSLGGLYGTKYTKNKCLSIAKDCKSKIEFMQKNWCAYAKSLKCGWIDNYTWFKRPKSYNQKYPYEVCYQEALKYTNGGEFKNKSPKIYQAAVENKWLHDYTWMKIKNTKIKNMIIEFYKNDLDFPLSGGDYFSVTKKQTIKRILNMLRKYIGKKTNIRVATNILCGKKMRPKDNIINKKGLISNTVINT